MRRPQADMSESSTVPAVHHSLPVHEVVLLLETDSHRGLSAAEADARLTRFGPNTSRPRTAGECCSRFSGSSTIH